MSTLVAELDRILENRSEADVKLAIGQLIKRITDVENKSGSFTVHDSDNRPLGVFVSQSTLQKPDLSNYHTLLAVAKYRSENPPERYLSTEEFIAAISGDTKQ